MPRGDRTGPEGFGPLSGRHMGYCAGDSNSPRFSHRWFGRGNRSGYGYGYGFDRRNRGGFGRGFGNGGNNFNDSEKELLKSDINGLKEQLSFLENKLSQVDDES